MLGTWLRYLVRLVKCCFFRYVVDAHVYSSNDKCVLYRKLDQFQKNREINVCHMYQGLDQKAKIKRLIFTLLMFVTELNLPKKIWITWKRPVFGLVVSRLFSPWFSFGTRWSLESFCVADENWRILVYAKKLSKKKCAHLSAQKSEKSNL